MPTREDLLNDCSLVLLKGAKEKAVSYNRLIKPQSFKLARKGEQPMRFRNAQKDVRFILSWFQEAFSSPSFKLFSSFILGFIQVGKEGHTSSRVQSPARSFLSRSLSSFTRFLGKNGWSLDEVKCEKY